MVGLDRTAFVFSTSSNTICELVLPPADKDNKEDLQEIQSVELHHNKDDYWCAVSRGDKKLAIYQWNAKDSSVEPKLVYQAPKRAVHMCFASLPNDAQSLCLVAGDLAGDAYAYSLTEHKSKLLLGHTASMLTGVAVVPGANRILTADRDEKVRVSRFPQSYLIEGYLLGHTQYITSIDTLVLEEKNGLQLVATCGGDSTIRLWNLDTLEQLSEIECPKDEKDSPMIPIKIALHPKGTMAAVIYDQSDRFDIYSIDLDGETVSLGELVHTTTCAATLLSVVFKDSDVLLTLQQDPNYLIAFEVTESALTLVKDATSVICQKASEMNIKLSDTILERDNWGNIKLKKLNETRGPSSEDAPWNRIERVDIAKERQKRHKKRKLEKKDAEKKEKAESKETE